MNQHLLTEKMAEAFEKALSQKGNKADENESGTQELLTILQDYYIDPLNETFYNSLKNQINSKKKADCISQYKGKTVMSWYQDGSFLLGCSKNQTIIYIPCSRVNKILAQLDTKS